ncbi:hypothetical protein PCASD_13114 [Puccinia coronata f. sp. avenae]|uniref:Autophagy-related protein n=1 Tax=Puccinia coronata f. sp. avenae TaxID=200324 RepID=A0A2N5UD96_9BASI|nr:hypothetical protein PCASD_13114 [Puccinia coronata f. sp. avenae]
MEPGHYSHFVEPRPSTSASHDFLDIHISRDSSCPDSSALDCLDTHPLNQPPSPLINTQLVPASSFKQHVLGFYSYSIASEIYSIVSTSLFLPIVLEQFARDNARVYPDYIKPCPGSRSASRNEASDLGVDPSLENAVCKTKIFGAWLNTSVFPLCVSSFTIAALAFLIISMSSPADNANTRKFLLIILAACGSLTGSMFFFMKSSSPVWLMVAVLSLVSNVSLGASTVCLNSLLAGVSKEKAAETIHKNGLTERVDDGEFKALVAQYTSQISARGVAYGFAFGISALGLCLILVIQRKGDLDSLRWAIGGSAVLWGLLTIPAGIWIPPRSFSFLDSFSNPFQPIKSGKEMAKMLKGYRRILQTIKFLIAWAFLSNSYSTMTSTAVLYAKAYLKMESSKLIVIGILTPSMGIMGALIFSAVQKHIQYFSGVGSSLKVLKLVVIPTCAIPLYMSTSVLFKSKALSSERDMYLVAAFFGMFYGGFQSYSRAVFTELIPPGQEARWNSLFSLTAKASSCSGPLIVGIITEFTHDMRYGFLFILALFIAALLVLQTINMEKGKKDAENYKLTDGFSDEQEKQLGISEESI